MRVNIHVGTSYQMPSLSCSLQTEPIEPKEKSSAYPEASAKWKERNGVLF